MSGAEKRKLIPIKYRSCDVPNILSYIAMLDYVRDDTKPWFWQRVAASLRAGAAPHSSAILYPFAARPTGYQPTQAGSSDTSQPWLRSLDLPGLTVRPSSTAEQIPTEMTAASVSSSSSAQLSPQVQLSSSAESPLQESPGPAGDNCSPAAKRHSVTGQGPAKARALRKLVSVAHWHSAR